jgi:hypothetical protein
MRRQAESLPTVYTVIESIYCCNQSKDRNYLCLLSYPCVPFRLMLSSHRRFLVVTHPHVAPSLAAQV